MILLLCLIIGILIGSLIKTNKRNKFLNREIEKLRNSAKLIERQNHRKNYHKK